MSNSFKCTGKVIEVEAAVWIPKKKAYCINFKIEANLTSTASQIFHCVYWSTLLGDVPKVGQYMQWQGYFQKSFTQKTRLQFVVTDCSEPEPPIGDGYDDGDWNWRDMEDFGGYFTEGSSSKTRAAMDKAVAEAVMLQATYKHQSSAYGSGVLGPP